MAETQDCTNMAASVSQMGCAGFGSNNSEPFHSEVYSYFQYALVNHALYPDNRQTNSPPAAEHSPPAAEHSEECSVSRSKRNRRNRYENCSPEVLSRRRAQNRNSQRAFRHRKDQRLKELEDLLVEERSKHNVLSNAYAALQAEMDRLESERRLWVLDSQQGNLANYAIPEYSITEQSLYTNTSGQFTDTSDTGYMRNLTYN